MRTPSNLPGMLQHRTSFCVALNSVDGKAPEWVELIPAADADGMVRGRDGRRWKWDAQAQNDVQDAFKQRGIDMVVDWHHATQLRADKGEEAPAASWVPAMEIRDGALWGRSQWTPRAETQVVNKEYRFLSPVFDYDPETLRIKRMVSAALTNTPNLHLQALNHEEPTMRTANLTAAIIGVLCLQADATDDAVAQAINSLKKEKDDAVALNSERVPSLDRYVPRADYNTLEQRAINAENALKDHNKKAHGDAVDAAIKGALEAGKITPATEEYHRAACSDAEGLARFQKFVGAAPAVGDESNLGQRKPENDTALNAEELHVCEVSGIDPKAFAERKAAMKA